MKAHKGDKVICGCGRAAGFFRNDLADCAIISGHDITITLPAGAIDGRNRYLCPDCKKVVARHFGGRAIQLLHRFHNAPRQQEGKQQAEQHEPGEGCVELGGMNGQRCRRQRGK